MAQTGSEKHEVYSYATLLPLTLLVEAFTEWYGMISGGTGLSFDHSSIRECCFLRALRLVLNLSSCVSSDPRLLFNTYLHPRGFIYNLQHSPRKVSLT